MALPSQQTLKCLLEYSPQTGEMIWRVRSERWFANTANPKHQAAAWNARCAGNIAFGARDAQGYESGRIFNKTQKAHRVIWKIMTGREPKGDIDHIDGNRSNNTWKNLREVTRSENQKNKCRARNNTSGVTGVHWNQACNKWAAGIESNGVRRSLGFFETIDEAAEARRAAEKSLGFTERHGL